MKKKWQEAYENYLGQGKINDQVKVLDHELNRIFKYKLPGELYDQVYNKTAALEALHNEDGFQAGFILGILEALKISGTCQNLTHEDLLTLAVRIAEATA